MGTLIDSREDKLRIRFRSCMHHEHIPPSIEATSMTVVVEYDGCDRCPARLAMTSVVEVVQ